MEPYERWRGTMICLLRLLIADMEKDERAEFFKALTRDYCPDCGSIKGTRCHCEDER